MTDQDRAEWFTLWQKLCRRFNRSVEPEEASDYLAYLESVGLDMVQIRRAVESAWATREFFPRPADFMAGEASVGWTALRELAAKWSPQLSPDDARVYLAAVPERSMRALRSLGGLDALQTARDFPKLRREYLDAFDRTLVEDSTRGLTALPAGDQVELPLIAPKARAKPGPARVAEVVGMIGWEGVEIVE